MPGLEIIFVSSIKGKGISGHYTTYNYGRNIKPTQRNIIRRIIQTLNKINSIVIQTTLRRCVILFSLLKYSKREFFIIKKYLIEITKKVFTDFNFYSSIKFKIYFFKRFFHKLLTILFKSVNKS